MRNVIRALACTLLLAALAPASEAQVFVGMSVNFAPPALPVYVQPPCPAAGYVWTPGYWAWGPDGYFWVPGTWVLAPVGLLWTPGYWGWGGGVYVWHSGYWGPHVGFYGGINYGFGYTGVGFEGGYWRGHSFYYNRSVANVSTTNITNVYNRTVVNNVTVNRVSFNGGAGGVVARPNAEQLMAARERRVDFTPMQREQQQAAARNPALRAAVNGGHPAIAATPRAGEFSGRGVVAAREARPPGGERPANAMRARGAGFEPQRGAAPRPGERGAMAQERPSFRPERPPVYGNPQREQRPNPQREQRPNPQREQRANPQERPTPQQRGFVPQQGRGGYAQQRGGSAPPRGGLQPVRNERRAEPAHPPSRGNERQGRQEERQH